MRIDIIRTPQAHTLALISDDVCRCGCGILVWSGLLSWERWCTHCGLIDKTKQMPVEFGAEFSRRVWAAN